MSTEIIIIGGGAAGMVAAISAARNGAKVTILEHKEKLGKKILATGNGKCNYTNLHQSLDCYRSENLPFVQEVFSHFNEKNTIDFFKELGIYPKSRNGYLYPNSEQASSIVDVLMMELEHLHVTIQCNAEVLNIKPVKHGFLIETKIGVAQSKKSGNGKKEKVVIVDSYDKTFTANKIIVTTGGKASSKLGSDGSGYRLMKQLGHSIIPVVPALVQLCADGDYFEKIAGIRCDVGLRVYIEDKMVASEEGELQLTNYGISGIPVFQISRYVAKALLNNQKSIVKIDFFPQLSLEELITVLRSRCKDCSYKSIEQSLVGLLNQKLITLFMEVVLGGRNIVPSTMNEKKLEELLQRLALSMKTFDVRITDTNGFENAQICAGGVDTTQVSSETLESKVQSGMYLAGELLDVDGICGGYNLQWAWTSGYLAGLHCSEN